MAAVVQDITAEQGAALAVTFTGAGASLQGRTLRMHVRSKVGVTTTKLVASTTDGRLAVGANPYTTATLAIDADIMAAVSITLPTEYWVYDVESYTTAADVRREWSGRFTITRDVTRDTEATTETALSGAVLYSGPQSLTTAQKLQARDNIGAGTGGGGGGSGDVVGPASSTDGRIAEFDGITGKLLRQSSYTITTLLAAAWARASHTGTQLAATISDFASAAIAAVTWSTLTGKPSTFDPSAHKTSHATGGSDALTASDIGAATDGHDHTGVYQPLATVLTNTTAAFTTAQETKLSGIETAADVTDAGNVGTAIDGATAKTTPVDADTVPLIDSAASNALKKLSWANIKATAKTYFDTLYQAASATLTTWAGITPGTGIATALAVNVGTAGAPVVNGGALGTPSSGALTNCTGYQAASTTASGIVELAIASEVSTGTDTARAMTVDSYKKSTPFYVDRAADWTLALTDVNADQWFNNGASALVCTIPLNATVAFAIGDTVPFVRLSSGTATIDADTSVTLNGVSGGSCTISTRYQGALLKKIGTDSWIVSGDVSAVA